MLTSAMKTAPSDLVPSSTDDQHSFHQEALRLHHHHQNYWPCDNVEPLRDTCTETQNTYYICALLLDLEIKQ